MVRTSIIDGYMKVSTASVSDAVDKIAGRRGYMDHEIKPRINEKKVVGPAVTILEGPTDEALPPKHALDAIDESPKGSVIVIAIGGETNVAVWGGLMTAGAEVNGHAGAVLDGGVRDVTEIRRDSGFQVFSRSVSPSTTVGRFKTLSANVPVICGGVTVNPGDLDRGRPGRGRGGAEGTCRSRPEDGDRDRGARGRAGPPDPADQVAAGRA